MTKLFKALIAALALLGTLAVAPLAVADTGTSPRADANAFYYAHTGGVLPQ